jgi:hypothetical protein
MSTLRTKVFSLKRITTFSSGCLGSHIDEERCELRYVMRIAEFSESSKFWTHIALSGYAWKYACISVRTSNLPLFFGVVRIRNGRVWGVSIYIGWSPLKCTLTSSCWTEVWYMELHVYACLLLITSEKTSGATSICGMLGFDPTLAYGVCFVFSMW